MIRHLYDQVVNQKRSSGNGVADRKIATYSVLLNVAEADKIVTNIKERQEINQKAKQIISQNKSFYTSEEKEVLRQYTGFGGAVGGDNDEYFTPQSVARASWNFLDVKHGDKILDPCTGAGAFSSQAPNGVQIIGCDLNKTSAKIADILNDNSEIQAGVSFEEFSHSLSDNSFDAVITNVPFGVRGEKYKKIDMPDVLRNEDYFILKSLDLLKPNKRAVFLTTSSTVQRKGKDRKATRLKMLQKGSFVGGVRLPSAMFKDTGTEQVVDILVFEKHPLDVTLAIKNDNIDWKLFNERIHEDQHSSQFLDGTYFDLNKKAVLGSFKSKEEMHREAEEKGEKLHHMAQRDTVVLPEGKSLDDIKKELLHNTAKYSNTFDYRDVIAGNGEVSSDAINYIELETSTRSELTAELSFIKDRLVKKQKSKADFEQMISNKHKLSIRLSQDDEQLLYAQKIILDNKSLSEALRYLLLTHPYSKEKILEYKSDIELIRKKDSKLDKHKDKLHNTLFVKMLGWINRIDLSTGEIVEDISELLENSEEQVFVGKKQITKENEYYPHYDKNDFSDDELMSDSVIIAGSKVMSKDGYLTMVDKQPFDKVFDEVSMIDGSILPKDLLQKKIEQQQKTVEAYKDVMPIENVKFSLKFVRKINSKMYVDLYDVIYKNKLLKGKIEKAIIDGISELKIDGISGDDGYSRIMKYNWYRVVVSQSGGESNKTYFDKDLEWGLSGYLPESKNISMIVSQLKGVALSVISRYQTVFSNIVTNEILSNPNYREEILSHFESQATITYHTKDGYNEDQQTELKGMLRSDIIKKGRHYQNADARKFANELGGVIAQDTGLGKSFTAIMACLQMIHNGKAKRPMLVVPNAVYPKWVAELEKAVTEDMRGKILTVNTKNKTDLSELMRSRKYKMLLIADSTAIEFIKLTDEDTDYLIGKDKKEENGGDENYRTNTTPLNKFGITSASWGKNATYFLEDLGVDAMIIDEGHHFKNATAGKSSAKGINNAKSSTKSRMMFFSEYIKTIKRGDSKGTILMTATPETSSPSEILTGLLFTTPLSTLKSNGISSTEEFEDMFFDISEETVVKANGMGMTQKEILVGLKNIKLLKKIGHNKIIYRTAEQEQARALENGYTINVKPDYSKHNAYLEATTDIKENFKMLGGLNEKYSAVVRDLNKGELGDLNEDDVASLMLAKEFGEMFGFISKARGLGQGIDVGLGYVPIEVNTTDQEAVISVLDENIKIKVKTGSLNHQTGMLEIDTKTEVKFSDIWRTPLNKLITKLHPEATRPPMRGKTVYLPTKDDKVLAKAISALKKAGFIGKKDVAFDIKKFTKYQTLIENMKKEIKRKPTSKQIIYSRSLISHIIIGNLIEHTVKEVSKVFYFKGGDKGFDLQTKFNSQDNKVTVMIFGKAGEVGVDFNKDVSAVHLMELPETPDANHQAMGRAVRQGNTIDKVHVYKYLQNGTFDNFLDQLINGKQDWIDAVKKGDDEAKVDTSDIESITRGAEVMFGDRIDLTVEQKIEMYIKAKHEEQKKKEAEISDIMSETLRESINDNIKSKYDHEKDSVYYFQRLAIKRYGESVYDVNHKIRYALPSVLSDDFVVSGDVAVRNVINSILLIKQSEYLVSFGNTAIDIDAYKTNAKKMLNAIINLKKDQVGFTEKLGRILTGDLRISENSNVEQIVHGAIEKGRQDYKDDLANINSIDETIRKKIVTYSKTISDEIKNGLSEKDIVENFDRIVMIKGKLYDLLDESYVFVGRGENIYRSNYIYPYGFSPSARLKKISTYKNDITDAMTMDGYKEYLGEENFEKFKKLGTMIEENLQKEGLA